MEISATPTNRERAAESSTITVRINNLNEPPLLLIAKAGKDEITGPLNCDNGFNQ
jgi:hypothetical protein